MSIESGSHNAVEAERPRESFAVERETLMSPGHPDRNDDAALGDRARLERERKEFPEGILLSDANHDRAVEHFKACAEKELAAADALDAFGMTGVFDGISGKPRGAAKFRGAGGLASRTASAESAAFIAKTMKPDMNAAKSAKVLERALLVSAQAINDFRGEVTEDGVGKDLYDMVTTGDLVRHVRQPDGGAEVAFAHLGDSRIYHYDAAEKKIVLITRDHDEALSAMERGEISDAERDLVSRSVDMMDYSMRLRDHVQGDREKLKDVAGRLNDLMYGGNGLTGAVSVGERKPDSGTFSAKAGDKVLVMSDGVFGALAESEILAVLDAGGGAKELVAAAAKKREELTAQLAKETGDGETPRNAYDDITVAETVI
ncbi:MAG: hypothetical protein RLZZ324_599 [Candidatus Parcubacteria bacterium]|jgi:serine/threonine protein phosphatase PrpC